MSMFRCAPVDLLLAKNELCDSLSRELGLLCRQISSGAHGAAHSLAPVTFPSDVLRTFPTRTAVRNVDTSLFRR